ncbi:epoxide hydrolase family protein [Serinicoccus marinus]|uniref:epoxide hydrolase family protein n=1 Tax=Serinicoccus marinus TaxID=247333 RepID=UPI002492F394|nr:epoxide hydrolase [Serinicoccus marinus]
MNEGEDRAMTDTTHPTPRDAEGAAPTITQEVLDDLAQRLARARWSTSPAPVRGMSTARLQELVRCWQEADWRSTEAWLADHGSALTTTADGRALHYLHVPGAGGAAGGLPIALLHGWPDSPLFYRRMLPLLVGAGHPVVVPSAILWLTGRSRSSIRLYSEPEVNWHADAWEEPAGDGAGSAEQSAWSGSAGGEAWKPAKVDVPTAFALFGGDLMMPPRELCERFFAVERFTLYPEGGHWPALEEPEQVVRDLLAFADGRS